MATVTDAQAQQSNGAQTQLETQKLIAEIEKLIAERDKLVTERSKMARERTLYPFALGVALIAAVGGLAKVILDTTAPMHSKPTDTEQAANIEFKRFGAHICLRNTPAGPNSNGK